MTKNNKVYCKNCKKFNGLGYICDDIQKINEFTGYSETIKIFYPTDLNNQGNCSHFKPKHIFRYKLKNFINNLLFKQ